MGSSNSNADRGHGQSMSEIARLVGAVEALGRVLSGGGAAGAGRKQQFGGSSPSRWNSNTGGRPGGGMTASTSGYSDARSLRNLMTRPNTGGGGYPITPTRTPQSIGRAQMAIGRKMYFNQGKLDPGSHITRAQMAIGQSMYFNKGTRTSAPLSSPAVQMSAPAAAAATQVSGPITPTRILHSESETKKEKEKATPLEKSMSKRMKMERIAIAGAGITTATHLAARSIQGYADIANAARGTTFQFEKDIAESKRDNSTISTAVGLAAGAVVGGAVGAPVVGAGVGSAVGGAAGNLWNAVESRQRGDSSANMAQEGRIAMGAMSSIDSFIRQKTGSRVDLASESGKDLVSSAVEYGGDESRHQANLMKAVEDNMVSKGVATGKSNKVAETNEKVANATNNLNETLKVRNMSRKPGSASAPGSRLERG